MLGFDERGREILTYLCGETIGDRHPWPSWVYSDAALTQVGAWARRLHDATATFVPPEGVTWFVAQTWRSDLVVGHHDAGPYNAVWHDSRLVGCVDWDTAGPSWREVDLAFVALSWVPLHARRVVEGDGFTAFDDRSRRLHLLLDAYGYDGDRSAFGAAVAGRTRRAAREVEALPASFWLRPGRPEMAGARCDRGS